MKGSLDMKYLPGLILTLTAQISRIPEDRQATTKELQAEDRQATSKERLEG